MMGKREVSGSICGGPDPGEMKACYGGCYEWCSHPLCSKEPAELSEGERRRIRRFQKRCGGYYLTDLRELPDFHLSGSLLNALSLCQPIGQPKPRQARALCKRGLLYEWGTEYHIMGEGAQALELAGKWEVP